MGVGGVTAIQRRAFQTRLGWRAHERKRGEKDFLKERRS